MKNKRIKLVSLGGIFLATTLAMNWAIQPLTFPIIGRLDFSHIPTIILGITGHPWLGLFNGFVADVLGVFLRGHSNPWLQISFAKGLFAPVAFFLAIKFRLLNKNKQLGILYTFVLFVLTYLGIYFIGYAAAFKMYLSRPVVVSAAQFYIPRAMKTVVMLPIWYGIIRYFGNKKM